MSGAKLTWFKNSLRYKKEERNKVLFLMTKIHNNPLQIQHPPPHTLIVSNRTFWINQGCLYTLPRSSLNN